MRTFSIAELEQYSFIKAHTIRVWEKRHGIFKAHRTATNYRYYSLEDFTLLLDFALLNRFGNKISALASLDRNAINQKLQHLTLAEAKKQHQINQLLVCMFTLNIEDFELILDAAVASWGMEDTIEDIILPFLERLGLFSYEDCSKGEYHFVVTAVRKKLCVGIEQTIPREQFATSAASFFAIW